MLCPQLVQAIAPGRGGAQDVLQRGRVVGSELGWHICGEAHDEVVGEMRADRGPVDDWFDAERPDAVSRADARAPQQKGILDHSRGEDHLARVDTVAVVELDRERAPAVDHHAPHVCVAPNREVGPLAHRFEVSERVRDAHALDAVHRVEERCEAEALLAARLLPEPVLECGELDATDRDPGRLE